jgi:hypothetical protein
VVNSLIRYWLNKTHWENTDGYEMPQSKELAPEILSHRIREQVVTEGIMPGTHYMIVNQALLLILQCSLEYVENIKPVVSVYDNHTAQYAGAIHGVWVLQDDKAIEMVIKPMGIHG